jgi:hypothetical protein
MPGFTATSMYPRMWAASGVDYPSWWTGWCSPRCGGGPACTDRPPTAQPPSVSRNGSASGLTSSAGLS